MAMNEFFDGLFLLQVNFHFNFGKIIKQNIFLKSNGDIFVVIQDVIPVCFSDKEAFDGTCSSVVELSTMVPCCTICSNDAIVVKLNTISLLMVNVKTHEDFSLLNKHDLVEFLKFGNDLNFSGLNVRF